MAGKKAKAEEKKGPATMSNRRAMHDYTILETHEAGIVLVGSEVKSLFLGRANLTDAYAHISSGEIWLVNLDIEPYEKAAGFLPERRRTRKLLMHKREIMQLLRKSQEKGLALIPMKMYFNKGKVKVLIGVGRGRKLYDKREAIKEKDERRAMQRQNAD